MPFAREFSDVISIVHTPDQFVAALEDRIIAYEKATFLHDAQARKRADKE